MPGVGEIWNRRITRAELDERLAGIHQPYHRQLGQALEAIRDRWGAALLIDLHSMPPLRRRLPDDQPAEFVIGDRFGASCDAMLVARALAYLGDAGRGAAHNRPYAGGYVLDRHAQPSRGIHALQLEVCRSTYLDARLSEPSARLPAVARLLAGLVRNLAACTATLGREPGFMLAAE
ncbi:N-formylglutamate amidohydrolase [Leptolyngbya sp. 15MV]|nr:N-formylglutamate amidohydrolase [Leptolyngbya sp. 15MV]